MKISPQYPRKYRKDLKIGDYIEIKGKYSEKFYTLHEGYRYKITRINFHGLILKGFDGYFPWDVIKLKYEYIDDED